MYYVNHSISIPNYANDQGGIDPTLCSYRIKMDENGARESHIDFYAQFNSLKA